MPHDCKGRKIDLGDVIKVEAMNTKPLRKVVGTVVEMKEDQFCTGQVRFQEMGGLNKDYFNAGESELILKADGSEPPVPK